MDLLGEALLTIRLLASTMRVADLGAPWGIQLGDERSHMVVGLTVIEGPCWVESKTLPLTALRPGDSALFLAGTGYRSMSSPDTDTIAFGDFLAEHGLEHFTARRKHDGPLEVRSGTGHTRTRLLGFALMAQDAGPNSVIANLPPAFVVRGDGQGPSSQTTAALAFLSREASQRPGYVAAAARWVELIFTELVREHVIADPGLHASWMRGLRDPGIGRALNCMHSQPGVAWSVVSLAREAGMARSTFARRFCELLGESPIDYLINHRMRLACSRLAVDGQSVAAVAEALGYQSERAFRHAFRSRLGMAPTHYARRLAREHLAGSRESAA